MDERAIGRSGRAEERNEERRLLEIDVEEAPDDPRVLFHLGRLAHEAGDHEPAAEWLRQCLAGSSDEGRHTRMAQRLLVGSLRALSREAELVVALQEALAAFPDDLGLLLHAGEILVEAGRQEEARPFFLRVAGADESNGGSTPTRLRSSAMRGAARISLGAGNYPEARDWWLQALDGADGSLECASELFEAALGTGDLVTAQRMVHAARGLDVTGEQWAILGGRYAEIVGGPENREQWLRHAVSMAPDRTGPRLVLARYLLETGWEGEASGHLHQLADEGVAEAAFFLGTARLRRNDSDGALRWLERALSLNPGHAQTARLLEELRSVDS